MAGSVIELDVSTPWEPPDEPAPSRRSRRWVAFAVVLVLAGFLPAGARASAVAGPSLHVGPQVVQVLVDNGRLYVVRHDDPGPRIEARRLSDGALVWSRAGEIRESIAYVGNGIVALVQENGQAGPSYEPDGIGIDSATGRELWRTGSLWIAGQVDGALVTVHQSEFPYGQDGAVDPESIPVNELPPQVDLRFVGHDPRTFAERWTRTIPKGTLGGLDYGSWALSAETLSTYTEVGDDNVLRIRDLTTGAVRGEHRLDVDGRISRYTLLDDRIAVWVVGETGGAVLDLATSRRLWVLPGQPHMYDDVMACGPVFCRYTENAVSGLDRDTGRVVWRRDGSLEGHLGWGQRMIFGLGRPQGARDPDGFLLMEAATGEVTRLVRNWALLDNLDDRHLLIWSPAGNATALLGVLDAGTGRIDVFARAVNWYGGNQCVIDETVAYLACNDVGEVSVWRLPRGTMT